MNTATMSKTLVQKSGVQESDRLLIERIDRALWADESLHGTNYDDIKIDCKSGDVRLSGHVATELTKTRAADAVRRVPNVAKLENGLTSDEELVHLVAHALEGDTRLNGDSIGVNVQHGFVYLFGTASNATVRQFACQIAAGLPQVRGVINRIQSLGIMLLDAEEDRILQPAIGKEVFFMDNRSGRIQQVIINPNNRRVTGLIAHIDFSMPQISDVPPPANEDTQSGLRHTGRTVVIPTAVIRYASTAGIFLNVNSSAAANFADMHAVSYVSPLADWHPPYPYCLTDVLLTFDLGSVKSL